MITCLLLTWNTLSLGRGPVTSYNAEAPPGAPSLCCPHPLRFLLTQGQRLPSTATRLCPPSARPCQAPRDLPLTSQTSSLPPSCPLCLSTVPLLRQPKTWPVDPSGTYLTFLTRGLCAATLIKTVRHPQHALYYLSGFIFSCSICHHQLYYPFLKSVLFPFQSFIDRFSSVLFPLSWDNVGHL